MKTITRLLFFLSMPLYFSNVAAQDSVKSGKKIKISKYYAGLGAFSDLKDVGGTAHSAVLLNSNFGLGVNFKTIGFNSKNKPADYIPGNNVLGGDAKNPKDHANFYSLMIIKEFNPKKSRFNIGIETGPSFSQFDYYSFKSITPYYGIFGYSGNYSVKSETKNTIGLSAKAKIYYRISNYFAVEFATFANLNSYQNFVGTEINALFGILKKKNN